MYTTHDFCKQILEAQEEVSQSEQEPDKSAYIIKLIQDYGVTKMTFIKELRSKLKEEEFERYANIIKV